MTDRRSFTIKKRLAIYARQNGICPICNIVMPHGQYEIDHILALIAGGDNSDGNLRAVHSKCHSDKTKDDVASHRKAQRSQAGGTKRKGPPMSGSRNSPFKKLMDGSVVRR